MYPPHAEFRFNDDVELLGDHAGLRPGTRGRILGRYARELDPTYLVRFGSRVCNDVRADEIALVAA